MVPIDVYRDDNDAAASRVVALESELTARRAHMDELALSQRFAAGFDPEQENPRKPNYSYATVAAIVALVVGGLAARLIGSDPQERGLFWGFAVTIAIFVILVSGKLRVQEPLEARKAKVLHRIDGTENARDLRAALEAEASACAAIERELADARGQLEEAESADGASKNALG